MLDSLALFVFIPFCKIKCTYCDFNVYAHLTRWMEPYADAVAREIQDSVSRIQYPESAHSIYLGGGTPALMPISSLEKILRTLTDSFALDSEAEITIEANPGNVDADQLRALRALGFNRLSLGVQSFDDTTLRRLNRGHSAADALTTFNLARDAGFDNISLDFIYGLPNQSLADWRATLERAVALAPEHLSLYALKVEEGTGLEHQIKRGVYAQPDDDLAADMYELAEGFLDAAGYEQYEISNWARRVRAKHSRTVRSDVDSMMSGKSYADDLSQTPNASSLRSQHNLTYWRNEPYLGFGAGAHSCFGGERFWHVLSPQEYIELIARGESVIAGRETINRELEMAESMILGLRLNEGIVFQDFSRRYGEDARVKYAQVLKETKELELIDWSDERVRLTPRGRLLSNQVFWRYLP